jgi:hypothetical protein
MKDEIIIKKAKEDYQRGINMPFGNKKMKELYCDIQNNEWLKDYHKQDEEEGDNTNVA